MSWFSSSVSLCKVKERLFLSLIDFLQFSCLTPVFKNQCVSCTAGLIINPHLTKLNRNLFLLFEVPNETLKHRVEIVCEVYLQFQKSLILLVYHSSVIISPSFCVVPCYQLNIFLDFFIYLDLKYMYCLWDWGIIVVQLYFFFFFNLNNFIMEKFIWL